MHKIGIKLSDALNAIEIEKLKRQIEDFLSRVNVLREDHVIEFKDELLVTAVLPKEDDFYRHLI